MDKNIIILNGPINSGKSTIGHKLADIFSDAIFIEGDDLAKRDGTLEQWIPLVLQAIVKKCAQAANHTIFVAFPLRPEDWKYLRQYLNANLMCVTLSPSLDVALSQRDSRKLTAWEKKRIQEMYCESYQSRGFSSLIHDNGSESADETAKHIAAYLQETLPQRAIGSNGA